MSLRLPIRALLLAAAASLSAAAQNAAQNPIQTPDPVSAPASAVDGQPIAATIRKPRTPRPPKTDAPAYNTSLIVLDAAHGGSDSGARLGSNSLEKDATVAFAAQLKPRLEAQGFTVVLTHPDAAAEIPQDARIELANRSHAVACLLLHASNGGHGVHLYTSALTPNHPSLTPDESAAILPWDTAQATVLPQSLRLSSDLATALAAARIPLVAGQSSPRPIDSLTCPAVAIELAPLENASAADSGYQTRIAESLTQALVAWRGHAIALTNAAAAAKAIATPAPADGKSQNLNQSPQVPRDPPLPAHPLLVPRRCLRFHALRPATRLRSRSSPH